jgi:hypothetical protein
VTHLEGSTLKVEVSAHGIQGDIAVDLQRILETELLKDDLRLRTADRGADNLIICTVTQFSQPAPTTSTETNYLSGSKKPQEETVTRYTGALSVSYQAKDGQSGRVRDSDNITAKYDDEFGKLGSTHKGIASTLGSQFGKLKHGKTEVDSPPTAAEVHDHLLRDVVTQIASRLVNTEEPVEVYLARGKFDDVNKQAETSLWTRYRETLETMTPLPNKEDDAYRLYNIGVAYEALAYESEDPNIASKFLQEAAIHYGRAVDDRPSEKYFLEPQKRIDTAMAHYKKLRDHPAGPMVADSRSPTNVGQSGKSSTTRSARSAAGNSAAGNSGSSPRQTVSAKGSQPIGNAVTPASAKAPAGKPLTNDQVVQMFKANMDEGNIIDTIKTVSRVDFDLSVEGEIKLAQNGVKGKILSAMKARSRQSAGH